MKYVTMAFQFAGLIIEIMRSEQGKEVVDSVLDIVENAFPNKGKIQATCATIRSILDVPDND